MAITTERAAELRTFPLKDRWSPEESLALIEHVDGTDVIDGIPLPTYVQTEADRVRWANAVRVASQMSEEPVSSPLVQQLARTLFEDRDTYS
jgi:hypothetical protein